MLEVARSAVSRFLICVFFVAGLVMPSFAGDPQKMLNVGPDGVAIKGYDTVAYFTESRPMKGSPEFVHSWRDAKWYFAKAEHRDLFAADPERYAPQFGGFCANGMSMGKVVAADPEAWTIVDGKLYIKFSEGARDRWRQDKAKKIEKANEIWADVQKQE